MKELVLSHLNDRVRVYLNLGPFASSDLSTDAIILKELALIIEQSIVEVELVAF